MKISSDHYKVIEAACRAVLQANPAITLATYQAQGLSAMRFNFDVFYAASIGGQRACKWVSDVLYPTGANDEHLGTALKRIMGNDGLSARQAAKVTA